MNAAPKLARRRGGRDAHWLVLLVIGGFALAAVVLTGIGVGRGFDAGVSGPPPKATAIVGTAEAPIILAGMGSQTTDPFYLAGGTYRSDWSAWGEAPEYPPCTHSAELMAVDPGNAETSLDMAEIELSVLNGQCLDRRIADKTTLVAEVAAWNRDRNAAATTTDWRFTTADARIKLKHLYPAIDL